MTVTLHHLEFSRSSRIIWLLEEMGVNYELVRHQRDARTFRSPQALAAVHPLSKAPTVVIDDLVMVESGAIIEYLIERFGDGKLAPSDPVDRAHYLEWLHFAEGTMAMPVILHGLAPRFGGLGDMLGGFVQGELKTLFGHAETSLQGRDFLVGNALSGADINLSYILEVADASGVLAAYPALQAYLERLRQRPAYQKCIELGGPIVFSMAGAE